MSGTVESFYILGKPIEVAENRDAFCKRIVDYYCGNKLNYKEKKLCNRDYTKSIEGAIDALTLEFYPKKTKDPYQDIYTRYTQFISSDSMSWDKILARGEVYEWRSPPGQKYDYVSIIIKKSVLFEISYSGSRKGVLTDIKVIVQVNEKKKIIHTDPDLKKKLETYIQRRFASMS